MSSISRFTIATFCACVLAVSLGVISLVAGLHRVPLSMTCASGAVVCFCAADIWRREWLKYVSLPFSIGAIVAFFLATK